MGGWLHINQDGTIIIYNHKHVNTHLIKQKRHTHGFLAVSIKNKSHYVHKLVAEAWVHNPKPISWKTVLHKDGNSLNNHMNNLEWSSKSNAAAISNKKQSQDYTYRGSSSISYKDVQDIIERLKKQETLKSIAKDYGVSDMSISRIRKRYLHESKRVLYTDEQKSMALSIAAEHGMKAAAISTGINYETIWRWRNELLEQQKGS